eukprot:6206763-Pleurochrysis_carterae.AAC.2
MEWQSTLGCSRNLFVCVCSCVPAVGCQVVSELKSAFNVYDRDGSGSIDALELQRMFHSLGVSADESEQARADDALPTRVAHPRSPLRMHDVHAHARAAAGRLSLEDRR